MGDEDLLEIIGNSKSIPKLQKHFKKMFAGVTSVIISEAEDQVVGICSKEGEEVRNRCVNFCLSVCQHCDLLAAFFLFYCSPIDHCTVNVREIVQLSIFVTAIMHRISTKQLSLKRN